MTTLKKCLFCKKKFDRPFRKGSNFHIDWGKYNKMKFCSLKCRAQFYSVNLSGKNHYLYIGASKCIDCGDESIIRRNGGRCRRCYKKYSIGRTHIMVNKRPVNFPECLDCRKKLRYGHKRCKPCYWKFNTGTNHYMWKKEGLSYKHLHKYIRKTLGKPTICSSCKKSFPIRYIHWANKSGNYLKNLSDWINLCVKCHRRYDLNKSKKKSRLKAVPIKE